MTHTDHVRLLQKGVSTSGGTWADLGSGDGAFTLALRDLLGPKSRIFSVDKDEFRLERQKREFKRQFPDSTITFIQQDFRDPLEVPQLEGIVMANSLHFIEHEDQVILVRELASHLKASGRFILVEYDAERGNVWVPYSISFARWQGICAESEVLSQPEFLDSVPSAFLNRIYSARSVRS